MRTGRRLGEVLIERGLLEERELGRLLAGQKGLPFVEVSASDAEPAALEMLSEENARHQVALPLRYEGGQLVVAVADPSNELMLENLRRTLGAAPKLVVAPYAELVKAIGEAYASPRPEAPPAPDLVVAQPEAPQAEAQPQPEPEVEPSLSQRRCLVLRPKEPPRRPSRVRSSPPGGRCRSSAPGREPANEPEPAPAPPLLPPARRLPPPPRRSLRSRRQSRCAGDRDGARDPGAARPEPEAGR